MLIYFNPRPREEGDVLTLKPDMLKSISIHALVKRATHVVLCTDNDEGDFNPRPREEGDTLVIK